MKEHETKALIEHYGRMFSLANVSALACQSDKAEMLEWIVRLQELVNSLPDKAPPRSFSISTGTAAGGLY